MKKLLKYLDNYKKECILAPLFKMLEALFELTVPLVIARMIDMGIRKNSPADIVRSFFLLVALAAIGLCVSCIAQFFAAKAATGFSKGLRHDLFAHILSFGFAEIDNVGTSTMITRMTSDVNILQNGVNMFLRLFLRSPFIVAGAMIMAFTIDFKAAGVFVLVIIALAIVIFAIMKTNIPLLTMAQKKLDDVLCLVRENLSGARVIRAFTLEDDQIAAFHNTNSDLTSIQKSAGKVSGLLNPLTYVIVNLAIVLLIKVGKIQIDAGNLSTGQVVALYNYMSQILLELIKFANLIVTLNKAFASGERVNEIFAITSGEKSEAGSLAIDAGSEPVVEFRNVSMKYHEGADDAVSNISFKINSGETFGIIGGTGAGKTTVANLIPAFYRASSGEVRFCGTPVNQIEPGVLRRFVGTVMQKSVLFEGTIRDNLKWGNPDATDEDLASAVSAAVCTEVVEEKGGFDGYVEAGGRNFSGGQRQRLSIARTLAAKPRLLILDDSASALDYMTDKKLRENIKGLPFKPTVIIIAQRSISVRDCDKILVLDDGEQVGLGTHDELMRSCEVYREIYESQYGTGGEEK